jgi:hypothetical protein
MRSHTLKENDFLRLKERLESDLALKEIVDSAMALSANRERRRLRSPYVSAPTLRGTPWKQRELA